MSDTEIDLSGQSAVVTGGGRGLGRAFALDIARLGAKVTVTGRNETSLLETVEMIKAAGGAARAAVGDVCDQLHAQRTIAEATGEFGSVDLLISNAGIVDVASVVDADPSRWWRVIEVNLRGPFMWLQLVLPIMIAQGSGRVINVSSVAAKFPPGGTSSYGASKAALSNLTACAASEMPEGIHLFAFGPLGLTDMSEHLMAHPGMNQAAGERLKSALADPDSALKQTLSTFRFLLSPEANHLAGRHIESWDDLDALRFSTRR